MMTMMKTIKSLLICTNNHFNHDRENLEKPTKTTGKEKKKPWKWVKSGVLFNQQVYEIKTRKEMEDKTFVFSLV